MAVFQALGKYPCQMHALEIVVNLVVNTGDKRLMRKLLMPSGPADLLPLRFLIMSKLQINSPKVLTRAESGHWEGRGAGLVP